jgi:hypothetical protein
MTLTSLIARDSKNYVPVLQPVTTSLWQTRLKLSASAQPRRTSPILQPPGSTIFLRGSTLTRTAVVFANETQTYSALRETTLAFANLVGLAKALPITLPWRGFPKAKSLCVI